VVCHQGCAKMHKSENHRDARRKGRAILCG
jgi:hypothetical protein